ncbi:MAG: aspartate aminotransferase family protein [Thermoplasmatales archaeon]|nr:aspartate aminotransferase family protein [Thermoplasmatales archaeon]
MSDLFDSVKEKTSEYLFGNYGRQDLCFDRGEGMYLYDLDGNKYLDLVSGIAVNALGYSHPKWVMAVKSQATRMAHVSNLYHVREQADLAEAIASITPGDLSKSLFANSGAEANEGALKLAVRHTGRKRILSAHNSFHGRTTATLGATGQLKYRDTFQALVAESFDYFDYGSSESIKSMIGSDTAAVIIEPVQGEGGVVSAPAEFYRTVRDLCDDHGALMIVDEVQTGMGRTGKWFGIENFGVVPDIITMAKALGAGVPIGAVVSTPEIAKTFTPGTHGTTFGGNPLACAAALATIGVMKEEKLVENAAATGSKWIGQLREIGVGKTKEVRGLGLIVGIEMDLAKEFQAYCLKNRVLVNVCQGNVVRLIPPLIIGDEETTILNDLLREFLSRA